MLTENVVGRPVLKDWSVMDLYVLCEFSFCYFSICVCLFGLIGNNLMYHFLLAISVRGMMREQTMVPESPSTKVEWRLPAGNIWELFLSRISSFRFTVDDLGFNTLVSSFAKP